MRYIGIDYGARRIGWATADGETRIAVPRGVILRENDSQAIGEIAAVLKSESIEGIIIGVPLGHDGRETDESREVRAFADKLKEKINVPIEFENEMFTTRMAAHEGVKKENADASSAAIILQSYLDNSIREYTNDK